MTNNHSSSDPCYCRPWHKNCDASTCSQAKLASQALPRASLNSYRKSGENGCQTCAIITSALRIPSIRQIWQQSIELALKSQRQDLVAKMKSDEEELRIELLLDSTGRRVLRTWASAVSIDWRHFNLWWEGNPSQRNSPCRAFPTLDYHPVERTDSERSIENLKSWIRACAENHSCFPKDDPMLPVRVVKVTEDRVRVVDQHGLRGRYMTLSHRWGINETFALTSLNFNLMTEPIPWDSIPRIYKESIELTRALGIEYIWIDSLCIVQDDVEDWKREAGKMKLVYGNSYLNIAATQAEDSYGGLFTSSNLGGQYPAQTVPQDPEIRIRPQPHLTHAHFGSNYSHSASNSPLMQRGWVLQERILSPRVVHFDTDEIKWECQAMTDCQCGGMVVIANFKRDYHACFKPNGIPLPYEWMRIAERYSSLKFTYDSDRLVALSGLAEQGVQSGKGGKYMAGVWERNIAHQLCWQIINTHRRPDVYLAPSWSWLSVFGTVRYDNRMDFTSRCSTIDVKIEEVSCLSKEGIIATATTSPIIGSIRLKGRGITTSVELKNPGTETTPPTYCLRREGLEIWCRADYLMSREEANTITEAFILYWGRMWPDQNTFLILKPIPDERRKFERLGLVRIPPERANQLGEILKHFKKEDDVVIV
ncbi:heterokaryon incompatibility protein-domain-containing protein [Xylaria bambusicola]|uniref:heterokaryon incompatibility protein-domain-containing protein n=1 Tax=Xylaria bambusicola TaxID=326684 RepID=UPI0020083F11|nr:heterokaryon incompatibility protein-domain-containing protein [Xylaria bambusicola]KAI0520854.1 heterokaryon incompatibility protein-domain-containing protein [Xylaria bambusicola]